MTNPDPWRFQWPDGTWIRWNPETEEWEKESGSPPTELDDDSGDEELYDFEEPEEEDEVEDDDIDDDDNDDDEGSRTRARPAEPVFAGRQLDERPTKSLMPTILGGAAIGVAVGIVVTILTR